MDYRFKEDISVIKFPEGFTEENRGLKECCTCSFTVMADLSDSTSYKNDIELVSIKKGTVSDAVSFSIEDCSGNILANLGVDAVYPQDNLAVGFMYSWRDYLSTYGIGKYIIKVNFTIAGISGGYTWGIYDLKPFSITNAKGSVRIKSAFNSYSLKEDIDYSGSNCISTLRFRGFFGDRQPKTEINQLIDKGRYVVKTTRENLNTYELKSDPLSECFTKRIIDQHLLNEDGCYISDHNASNHSYQYYDTPVVLQETAEIEYRAYYNIK